MSPQTFWGLVGVLLGVLIMILVIRDLIADHRRRRDLVIYFKCDRCGWPGKVYRTSTIVTCHNCGHTFRPHDLEG